MPNGGIAFLAVNRKQTKKLVLVGASDPPTFSSQFPPNMTSAQKADLGDVSTKPELTLFIYSQKELPRVY